MTDEEREAVLMAVSSSITSIQRGYRAAVDKAVAPFGLSQSLAGPIAMIGRVGNGTRPGNLADLLGIEGPSLVRSLDQLVAAGMVERRDDAVDRRAKTLHLTRAGNVARVKIEAALSALRESLFVDVGDDDAAACLRVLALLEQRLGRVVSTIPEAALVHARRRTR